MQANYANTHPEAFHHHEGLSVMDGRHALQHSAANVLHVRDAALAGSRHWDLA